MVSSVITMKNGMTIDKSEDIILFESAFTISRRSSAMLNGRFGRIWSFGPSQRIVAKIVPASAVESEVRRNVPRERHVAPNTDTKHKNDACYSDVVVRAPRFVHR
jgi:hypothetical protein